MDKGLVYFIAYDNAEWRRILPVIKIGSTFDLDRRLKQLNTGSPVKLVEIGYIESNIPKNIERRLHLEFQYDRLNGEWFRFSKDMIETIMQRDVKNPRFSEFFDFDTWEDYKKEKVLAQYVEYNKSLHKIIQDQQTTINELQRKLTMVK